MSDENYTNYENIETHIKPKKTSEVKDIIIAWLGISLCFALVLGGYSLLRFNNLKEFSIISFLTFLGISLIVTGTAFILHELAHKYSAIYFGAKAKFVKWNMPLIFAIVFAFIVGFVFVAPGAVYVFGKKLSRREDGIVSLSGPVTNIILGFLFMGIGILGLLPEIVIFYGVFINFWIALFNLLPIGPLDGRSIFLWNPFIWVITAAIPFTFIFVL
jgi:Zn-dependent protease